MDFLLLLKGPYASIVNFIEYCLLKIENCLKESTILERLLFLSRQYSIFISQLI